MSDDIVKDRKDLAEKLGVPMIPPLTPEQKKQRRNPEPNPTVAICGECGIEIKQVMHYNCPNNNCPCFIKFTYC